MVLPEDPLLYICPSTLEVQVFIDTHTRHMSCVFSTTCQALQKCICACMMYTNSYTMFFQNYDISSAAQDQRFSVSVFVCSVAVLLLLGLRVLLKYIYLYHKKVQYKINFTA